MNKIVEFMGRLGARRMPYGSALRTFMKYVKRGSGDSAEYESKLFNK